MRQVVIYRELNSIFQSKSGKTQPKHFLRKNFVRFSSLQVQGWRMVKSETRRDAETLVRNPSPRLFGKKFRDSKKVKTNHAKTRLRDLSKTLPRFRDPVKIFRDPRFSRYHSPPLGSELSIFFYTPELLYLSFISKDGIVD